MLDVNVESQLYMTPFAIEHVIFPSYVLKIIDFHEGKVCVSKIVSSGLLQHCSKNVHGTVCVRSGSLT
jgi:hypothetical protein